MKIPFLASACFLLVAGVPLSSGESHGKSHVASMVQTGSAPSYRPFLVNNIFAYFGNNGDGLYNPHSSDHHGFELFKGMNKHAFYNEGLVWGGFHKGRAKPKVGGSVYRHALQPGPIARFGTAITDPVAATDSTGDRYRIYRVRPDINPGVSFGAVESKLQAEEVAFISRYESTSGREIYDQYIKDWNEWPAALGAPFTYGKNASGVERTEGDYDPQFDIPGMPDAMQTLWYVANDLDSSLVADFAGSPPIGLEVQRTIWGYTRNMGPLTTTIFEKTILINKSGAPVDSMYFAQWSDPDLGDAGDDYVGCDTTRDLGYVYNAKTPDAAFGTSIPAAGFVLLQGPIVPSAGNVADYNMARRDGFRNLPMMSFTRFAVTQGIPFEPQDDGADVQWYRIMRGLSPQTGTPIVDPSTNQQTRFHVPGDPLAAPVGTGGWVDGTYGFNYGDRFMSMATGPFMLADADTQELVVACVAAWNTDRLSSVTSLRDYADKLRVFHHDLILSGVGDSRVEGKPVSYALWQNYPNPFNPTTVVSYQLASVGNVRLVVYDLLGREVAVLLNEKKEPGKYSVTWNASGMASGVYFCRMQSGDPSLRSGRSFVQTKSMVLLK